MQKKFEFCMYFLGTPFRLVCMHFSTKEYLTADSTVQSEQLSVYCREQLQNISEIGLKIYCV